MAKRYGLVDLDTGELYRALILPILPKVGGKWVRLYQDTMLELIKRHPQMRGESMRVLLYLQTIVGFQNLLPDTGATAKELGLQQTNAARAYKELREAGFIIRREGNYYLNPFVYWKGTQEQMKQACRKLIEPSRNYLPLPHS